MCARKKGFLCVSIGGHTPLHELPTVSVRSLIQDDAINYVPANPSAALGGAGDLDVVESNERSNAS
jgi:hypothetical protein